MTRDHKARESHLPETANLDRFGLGFIYSVSPANWDELINFSKRNLIYYETGL